MVPVAEYAPVVVAVVMAIVPLALVVQVVFSTISPYPVIFFTSRQPVFTSPERSAKLYVNVLVASSNARLLPVFVAVS